MGERLGAMAKAAIVFMWSALTALFGFAAVVAVVEIVGPSETSEARVTERSSFEWERTICGARPGSSTGSGATCRTIEVPSGAVAGERPDGTTWAVVDLGASDVAGPAGSDIEVTTSTVTGRVVKLDTGRSFESTWNRGTSGASIAVLVFGTILVACTIAYPLFVRKRGGGLGLSLPVVVAAASAGVVVGLVGSWVGLYQSAGTYEAPSSAEIYGDFVADPYSFVGATDGAEEDGRVVEAMLGADTYLVRLVLSEEWGPQVLEAVGQSLGRFPVVLTMRPEFGDRIFSFVRVSALIGGELVEAEACTPDWDEPQPIGVDEAVLGAIVCFDAQPDSGEVFVAMNLTDRGVALNVM